MIKIILIISLILTVFGFISPYILDVVNYFNIGLNTILDYVDYIVDFLTATLGAFTQYNYLMMIFYLFLSLALIKLIINKLGG